MTTRNQRIAEIEVLFRAGNDRMYLWEENQVLVAQGKRLWFLCECGDRTCRKRLQLTGSQYEAVRADASQFVVAPGHELPEAEDVIEVHADHLVVRKHEDVRDLVERMDLRRGGPQP